MGDTAAEWYYSVGGQKHGPVTAAELKRLTRAGEVAATDLVWKDGMAEWRPAGKIKGLFPAAPGGGPPALPADAGARALAPLPGEEPPGDAVRAFAAKKTLAGVLGILLGTFGVHKFVLGLTTPGAIMLGASLIGLFGGLAGFFCLVTLPMLALPSVVGTIGLVEGILYLTKSDEEFYRRYAVQRQGWF